MPRLYSQHSCLTLKHVALGSGQQNDLSSFSLVKNNSQQDSMAYLRMIKGEKAKDMV